MTKEFPTWWVSNVLIYFLITTPMNNQGARILAVLPSVWKSHYLFGHHLLSHLVEQNNHTVNLISPYKANPAEKITDERFQEIKIDDLLNNWIEMGLSFNLEEMHDKPTMEHFTRLMYATTSNTDCILQNTKVRELLQSPQQFDILIADLFLSDALLGLSFYYQIPTVVLSPSGSNTWLNQRFGNPQNAALDPSNFLPYTKDMTFSQRCVNTLMAMFEKLTYSFFHMISQQAVYTKHFEPLCQLANWCNELPHHKELTENLSLALINTHPILQYPRAFLPNMLSIAGIHLKTSENELALPSHIKQFIEGAANGVIYMSFGANKYGFPVEKLELFFDVFETLPEMRFIIKYDDLGTLPSTLKSSSQIMLSEWWPQQAILAHDKVNVFITSCGFMSITEALYFNKSILGIPITPEQYVMCNKLNQQNAAYVLNFSEVTYDQIIFSIKHLLEDIANYKQSVKKLRKQLIQNLDNVDPLKKAVIAIEATLQTNGLEYLKSHSHHLNFWNSILLDVMFILIVGLLAILAIPFLLTCCILKRSYQNQNNLNIVINQPNPSNHRHHCNEFLSTTPQKNCNKTKHRRSEKDEDTDESLVWTELRRSSNSEITEAGKPTSSNSSSWCNCSLSPPSTPTTPSSKKEFLQYNQVSVNNDKSL